VLPPTPTHPDRLKILGEIENSQLGVYAIFQDGAAAELARRAVDVLIAHVQASRADWPSEKCR